MNNATFRGKSLDSLNKSELKEALQCAKDFETIYINDMKLNEYLELIKYLEERIAILESKEEKIKFYITDKDGDTMRINLYWFEENHIKEYSDLLLAGYFLTIDVGDRVSFSI